MSSSRNVRQLVVADSQIVSNGDYHCGFVDGDITLCCSVLYVASFPGFIGHLFRHGESITSDWESCLSAMKVDL